MTNITTVILAYNEADCIAAAIESAQVLQGHVLVLDSESTDTTREIATQAGAEVRVQPWLGYVEQRNMAFALVDTDWVLFLDADEQIPAALATELLSLVQNEDLAGARLRRENRLLGQPLHCAREAIPRLVRRGKGHWEGGLVHERLQIDGNSCTTSHALDHNAWPTLESYIQRHTKYARLMAHHRAQLGRNIAAWDWLRPLWSLPKFLVLKGGWRDGWRGITFALLHLAYSAMKIAFQYEYQFLDNTRQKHNVHP